MSSIQINSSVHIVKVATDILGGKPMGEALTKGLSGGAKGAAPGGPSLADLQNLQKQLETTRSQVDQTIGALKQAQAQFDAKPGCMSPSSVPPEVMNNPLQFLMVMMGVSNLGQQAAAAPSGGPVKHAKAPLAGDNFGPFAAAANNRCSGHNQLFDGSNPWQKQGAARDEAGLVGWAMQKTDNVQYDTDRKMFYQTEANGAKTDLMSLADLKKVADGAGGVSQNNGGAFNAVGAALDQASAKAASKPQLQQQASPMPTMQQLLSMLTQLMQKLQGAAAGGANGLSGTQNAGSTTGGSGSGSASGPGASSSPSSTGGISTTDSSGWGKLDDMKSQIDKLASSDKQSDQLKAQQMMAQMQRMFEMISKMMEQLSQMLSKSIQAWH